MKCNLEFFVEEKMGFVSIDTAGANQLIRVLAFIYFKTRKCILNKISHPVYKLYVDKAVDSFSTN